MPAIIPGIPDGNYIIKAMVIGYDTGEQQINANNNLKVNFELSPTPIEGAEIKVSAERMRFEKKVDISRVNLTNRDIRRTPAFIESDVFRTLQLLPSVNASNARAEFLQKVKENARRERRERIAIITKKEIEDYLHKKTTNHES